MLKKEHRLRLKKDITRVAKMGHPFFTKRITLRFMSNQEKTTRVTVLVGLNFSKAATKRNKIKRQLREIIRQEFPKIKNGLDIIVHVKPAAVGSTYPELAQDISYALRSTRLYV